jgi:hypothetical protein
MVAYAKNFRKLAVMITPQVALYYSETLLGHFTLIVSDPVELIAFRVHFVDRDAETAKGGKLAWAQHKVAQATGFATGRVLMNWQASPLAFKERIDYATAGRSAIKIWPISVLAMDKMLNWAYELTVHQSAGHSGNYGYVVYSDSVDNCGSWALKCLAKADILIQLPTLKSWVPLPSLIHQNIV